MHSNPTASTAIMAAGLAALLLIAGCHQAAAPHVASSADIDAAQQEAQREIADAKAEASKDVKSAAKVSGSDAAVVAEAKVTAKYDVAMAKADGDHKVAAEKCLTLQPEAQAACNSQADADYESAKAAAKATRLAKRQ
jgi:hypothetical protein